MEKQKADAMAWVLKETPEGCEVRELASPLRLPYLIVKLSGDRQGEVWDNPLSSARNEIRLLYLLGGPSTEAIQGELEVVSLDDNPGYEALSYCWGSQDNGKTITINSQPVYVTRNLHNALMKLRLPQNKRVLWIDALCINQNDTTEKELQVSLMSQIYGKTNCGLLWLGEEPEQPVSSVNEELEEEIVDIWKESDDLLKDIAPILQGYQERLPSELKDALYGDPKAPQHNEIMIGKTTEIDWRKVHSQYMTTLMQDSSLVEDGIFHAFCLLRLLEDHHHLNEIPYLTMDSDSQRTYISAGRHALAWILKLPWFDRIWTVQECILPKSCIIMYGPVKAAWTMFLRATENFKTHRSSCCADVPGVNTMLQPLIETLGHMSEFTQARLLGSDIPLDSLLRSFRARDATDPRDKVYGLLPLVTEWYDHDPIFPDYNISTTPTQTYTRAVLKMIEISGSLDILSQPGHYLRKASPTLPTWVPDYSQRITRVGTEIFGQNASLYDACDGRSASVRAISEKFLVLEGRRIGHIREAAARMVSLHDTRRNDIYLDWYDFADARNHDVEIRTWKRHFWRTLCGDCIAEKPIKSFGAGHAITATFRRVDEDDESKFHEWCRFYGLEKACTAVTAEVSTNLEVPQDSRTESIGLVDEAIRISTLGRRFFISEEMHMGLAPSHTAISYSHPDEIFVIPGARSPFVLRPVGERYVTGDGIAQAYEVVGECYLHGFMDGEGMADFQKEKRVIYLV
ncbi:heterokaryon incompatibility protein-domain-containing protein [Bisporella sp. PMI_857]|nr:heterokaryon incompatibility protein-domain-containing protein [Bisporella sp. PMI_857]KAH8600395.1 heterokaryon incompatibility protein-domain-containing protein [Bisporella sp. PMI_857]